MPRSRRFFEAVRAVLAEREYQTAIHDEHPHDLAGWLLILRAELREAEEAWVGSSDVLDEVRQVAAVAFACMEQHGVRHRAGWRSPRAKIVTLCGSPRFVPAFNDWRERFTLDGRIVLSIEIVTTQAPELDPQHVAPAVKERLDLLHLEKIDMSDEVFVLDVGGYIGESTRREIEHAQRIGVPVRYLSIEYPNYVMPASATVRATSDGSAASDA